MVLFPVLYSFHYIIETKTKNIFFALAEVSYKNLGKLRSIWSTHSCIEYKGHEGSKMIVNLPCLEFDEITHLLILFNFI